MCVYVFVRGLCLTQESVCFIKTLQAFNSDALEIISGGVRQKMVFFSCLLLFLIFISSCISWVAKKCDSVVIEFGCQHSSGPQSSLENTVIIQYNPSSSALSCTLCRRIHEGKRVDF